MQITENLKNLLESLYIVLEDYSPKIEIVSEKEFSDAGKHFEIQKRLDRNAAFG